MWIGLRKDVRAQLRNCAVCLTNNRHFQNHAMGDMPIASYPIQIIGADLIGPLVESPTGNRYILTIIDFCTVGPKFSPYLIKLMKVFGTPLQTDSYAIMAYRKRLLQITRKNLQLLNSNDISVKSELSTAQQPKYIHNQMAKLRDSINRLKNLFRRQ